MTLSVEVAMDPGRCASRLRKGRVGSDNAGRECIAVRADTVSAGSVVKRSCAGEL